MVSDRLKKVIAIAQKAGSKIMEIYNRPETVGFKVTTKSDHSPLTEADLSAHTVIVEELSKLTPGIPIISEESQLPDYNERSEWNSFWLVDPLDGTKEFIKRNGEFTVNIALIEEGVPVLGVVYAPAKKLLYFAEMASGSFKQVGEEEATRIFSSKADSSVPLRMIESRSHGSEALETYLKENNLKIKERISSGSSIKICLVAEGKADFYPRMAPTMEWDVAAGDAIYRYSCTQGIHSSGIIYNKPNLKNESFIFGF